MKNKLMNFSNVKWNLKDCTFKMLIPFLFFTVHTLQASTLYYYQGPNFNLNIENKKVEDVLKMIEEQSDYRFFYIREQVDVEQFVTANVSDATLEGVLQEIFGDKSVSHKIMKDNLVVLKPIITENKGKLVQEKQKNISGKVVDESGLPIPGVNIVIKGTLNGNVTNIDGGFSILLENETATLIFSFVGYKTKEVYIGEDDEFINVQLQPAIASLQEIIVVAYNEQSKASFTGSAVAVDLDEIGRAPRESFQQSLQGTVTGVFSQNPSGQPGSMPTIRIRGVGSMNASNAPLYVVDGIPLSKYDVTGLATSANTIAGINPDDIATLTVLKDASATSIYGSRAANGVILITTKNGSAGKTKFDFKVQYGISDIIMEDRNKPLRTDEIAELLIESRVNYGDTQTEAEDYIYGQIDRTVDTDWFDVITRTGSFNKYSLSASGGNNNTTFYTSLSYHDQEGVVIGIDYQKLNAKLNMKHTITDKMVLNVGVSANNQILHTNSEAGSANNPIRALARTMPWFPVYNDDGTYNTDYLLTYNPVGLVNENIRESKLYGILGNIGLKWYLFEGLSFESRLNTEFNLADEFQYDNPYFGEGRNDGGRGRSMVNRIVNWNMTNLFKYNIDINDVHQFNFTLGYEAQKITRYGTFAYARNYSVPGLYTLASASVPYETSSTETASAIDSYLFSASYNYDNRYFVNLTGRRDGSSRFGSAVRYANFGSLGLSWSLDKESFISNLDFINELKIRTSYGINGNQDGIDDFATLGLYSTGENYANNPGFTYMQQSNPDLTWEKNIPFNIGVDFKVLSRLSGTIEYYHRTTSNLLMNVPLSGTNGITTILDNRGEMVNSGLEISLSSQNIRTESGFSWITDFNLSTNNNEITSLPGDEPIITTTFIRDEGYEYYSFYLIGYAGVDPDNGDALWYLDESETATTNNYAEAERYYQGSSMPDLFGGLTNTFSYKNISLSFLLYYNYGNKVYDYWGRYIASDGKSKLNDRGMMSRKIYDYRWQNPGDITDVPKVVWGNTQSGSSSQHSTRFLYDGSFIRLRDLTLAYSLPSVWTEKVKLSSASVYLRGSNLWTYLFDKSIESDPEVGLDGLTDLRIPATRQLVFGIDLSF